MNTAKIPLGMVLPFLLVWQKNANAKSYLAEMKRTGSEDTNDEMNLKVHECKDSNVR